MKIDEICKKFKITNIPKTLMDIDLEEDVGNFTEYKKEGNTYIFSGEYKPYWLEGKEKLDMEVIIDLTNYPTEVLDNVDDIARLGEVLNELPSDDVESILFSEAVIFMKEIGTDGFRAFSSYDIFGGLVRIS